MDIGVCTVSWDQLLTVKMRGYVLPHHSVVFSACSVVSILLPPSGGNAIAAYII